MIDIGGGLSGQLESPHFFRTGDTVRSVDGRVGTVDDASTLFATIRWELDGRQEVDQFDPSIVVLQRAEFRG
jgi:hypothetical protein